MTLEKRNQAAICLFVTLPFVIRNAFPLCAIDRRRNVAFSHMRDLRPSLTGPAAVTVAVAFPIPIARSSGADPNPVG